MLDKKQLNRKAEVRQLRSVGTAAMPKHFTDSHIRLVEDKCTAIPTTIRACRVAAGNSEPRTQMLCATRGHLDICNV